MRLIVGGGRAAESSESKGAVVVGVRTLSEGGRVGNFSREQVSVVLYVMFLFRINYQKVLHCVGQAINSEMSYECKKVNINIIITSDACHQFFMIKIFIFHLKDLLYKTQFNGSAGWLFET